MLARAVFAASITLGAACTLTTDLNGLADDGTADAAAKSRDGAPAKGNDGSVARILDSGAPDAPACTADFASDSSNCGVCGKSCLGGACVAGRCQPTVLQKGVFSGPLGVAVSATKVYVGDGSAVTECNLDGSQCKTVVPNVDAHYLFTTASDLYFSDETAQKVKRWPLAGGTAPVDVTSITANLEGVAVSMTTIYFARYTTLANGGGVYSMPSGGGSPTVLKKWDHPEGLTFANGKVYIGSDGTDSAVELAADGTPKLLLSGGGPTGVAVDGDDAYITRQGAGELVHVQISTGAATPLVTGLAAPSGITVKNGAVYWVEHDLGNLDVLVL